MYRVTIVLTADGTFIPIKHIESINSTREEADSVIDNLREDFVFRLTTLSGKEHEVSMKKQVETFGIEQPISIQQLFNDFLEKWINLTTKE